MDRILKWSSKSHTLNLSEACEYEDISHASVIMFHFMAKWKDPLVFLIKVIKVPNHVNLINQKGYLVNARPLKEGSGLTWAQRLKTMRPSLILLLALKKQTTLMCQKLEGNEFCQQPQQLGRWPKALTKPMLSCHLDCSLWNSE